MGVKTARVPKGVQNVSSPVFHHIGCFPVLFVTEVERYFYEKKWLG